MVYFKYVVVVYLFCLLNAQRHSFCALYKYVITIIYLSICFCFCFRKKVVMEAEAQAEAVQVCTLHTT